jgi:glutaredoxin
MHRSVPPSLSALAASLLILFALPVCAQQYKWIDEKGRVQYTDTPPPPSARDVQKKNLKGSVVGAVVPFELTRAVKDAPVTLYTSPPCGISCDKARDALNARGVPFKEVQVWDEESNAELRKISNGREVPVLVVGSRVQTGFEQGAYDRALDIGGYPKAGIVPPLKQAAPAMPEDYKPAAGGTPPKPAAEPAAQK